MSPLRPWEWANLAGDDARIWIRTLELRNAVAEGAAAARHEKAGWERLEQLPVVEAG